MPRVKHCAPKRRAVASSSSSSDDDTESFAPEGFDQQTFVSEEAYKSFLNFSIRKVHTGSTILLGQLEEYSLLELFESQGWVNFLSSVSPVYATQVRIFYSNLTSTSSNLASLSSKIHGRLFNFTDEMLGFILGIPAHGVDIFDENIASFNYPHGISKHDASMLLHNNPNLFNDVYARTLTNRVRVLANVLSHCIVAKTGSRDKLIGYHKLLTYCILAQIPVNLPLLIMKSMFHISGSPSTNLYYGSIITKILEYFHFDLSDESDIAKQDQDFGVRNINLMKSAGALRSEQPPPAPTHASPPHVPHPDQPPFDFQGFEQRLFQRIDQYQESTSQQIHHLQDQFNTWQLDVQQQEHNIQTHLQEVQEESRRHYEEHTARMEYHMNYLYDQWNFPPPPPFHFPGTDADDGGDN